MAAGAASLMSVSAFAADLPTVYPPAYSPPPDNFGGGWYLRGDIGMSNQRVKRLDNVLQTAPNTTTQQIGMGFDSAPTFGVGVGYQFNSWLRADVTGEYRGKASFNGLEIEQSYSERQLYEAALDRLSRELAAVQQITETEAVKEIEAALAKGPRRGPKPTDAELENADDNDSDGDEDVSADEAA